MGLEAAAAPADLLVDRVGIPWMLAVGVSLFDACAGDGVRKLALRRLLGVEELRRILVAIYHALMLPFNWVIADVSSWWHCALVCSNLRSGRWRQKYLFSQETKQKSHEMGAQNIFSPVCIRKKYVKT